MLLECLKEDFLNCEIKEFKIEVEGFTIEVSYTPTEYDGRYMLHSIYNKFEDWDFSSDPCTVWDRINGFFKFIENIKLSPEMYKAEYINEMNNIGCTWINEDQIDKIIREVMGDDYEIK